MSVCEYSSSCLCLRSEETTHGYSSSLFLRKCYNWTYFISRPICMFLLNIILSHLSPTGYREQNVLFISFVCVSDPASNKKAQNAKTQRLHLFKIAQLDIQVQKNAPLLLHPSTFCLYLLLLSLVSQFLCGLM